MCYYLGMETFISFLVGCFVLYILFLPITLKIKRHNREKKKIQLLEKIANNLESEEK